MVSASDADKDTTLPPSLVGVIEQASRDYTTFYAVIKDPRTAASSAVQSIQDEYLESTIPAGTSDEARKKFESACAQPFMEAVFSCVGIQVGSQGDGQAQLEIITRDVIGRCEKLKEEHGITKS